MARSALPPVVTTLIDENDARLGLGTGESLRELLEFTRSLPGETTIGFADGLQGTMTLAQGPLVIAHDVTIDGPGADVISISGDNVTRVLDAFRGEVYPFPPQTTGPCPGAYDPAPRECSVGKEGRRDQEAVSNEMKAARPFHGSKAGLLQ